MFYHARYYAPSLGRFVSADTIVPEPGNPQYLNRYSYVANRPLQGGDPTGHQGPVDEDEDEIDWDLVNYWVDYWNDPAFSDWWSGEYGGCFMCHAGGGRTPLTNEELAAAEHLMQQAALEGTAAAGLGAGTAAATQATVSAIAKWLCGDGDCGNEISAAVQSYLDALPEPRTMVKVPTGQINSQIMAELQRVTGDEFALIRVNGERLLVRGYSSGAWLPPEITRLIAHTHPITHQKASGFDRLALEMLDQAWSLIILENGSTFRFP